MVELTFINILSFEHFSIFKRLMCAINVRAREINAVRVLIGNVNNNIVGICMQVADD